MYKSKNWLKEPNGRKYPNTRKYKEKKNKCMKILENL